MQRIKRGKTKEERLKGDKYLRSVNKGFKSLKESLDRGDSFSNSEVKKEFYILKRDIQKLREYIKEEIIFKGN
jgi:hypothetical protein